MPEPKVRDREPGLEPAALVGEADVNDVTKIMIRLLLAGDKLPHYYKLEQVCTLAGYGEEFRATVLKTFLEGTLLGMEGRTPE